MGQKTGATWLGSEQCLRMFVQNVKDYAFVLIEPDGRVAGWNPGAERLKGYREEEIIGKHFSIFYPKDDIERGKPKMELERATAEGTFEDEGWRVRKDGGQFWANVVITSLRDKNGALMGFGKITRDLTERKRSEELLTRQAQEILALSTPVVRVWEGVVLLPLIGTLDSQRTQQMMEQLLNAIVETNSSIALVDITGVPAIDSKTARHLVETINAVRLLGAEAVLTGVRPAIAQTLVHLGLGLTGVTTRSSLIAGIRYSLDSLGLRISGKTDGGPPEARPEAHG